VRDLCEDGPGAAGEPLPAAPRYRLGTRMRWLGGDVSRLAESVRRRGRPDVPRPGRAARDLLTGFAHPQDYLARDDPGPALRALAGKAADYARRSGALT